MAAAARWAAASALLGAAAGPAGVGAREAADPGDVEPHVPTELPRPGWPGPSAAESQGLWPSGHQPQRHEAWPQRDTGAGHRALLPCWRASVLADHDLGWPGVCLELFRAKEVSDEHTCRELCLAEPRCPVWQFENQTSPGQCWAGYGKSCVGRGGRPSTITVQGAQRIMHGEVRVLQNMSGWKIRGLFQLGELTSSPERGGEGSADRCRRWCYSDIGCQYWQYGPGGCWVDSPLFSTQHGTRAGNVVQYPLTTDGGATNTGYEAEHMRWGEYIQHYCPPRPGEVTSVADLLPEEPRQGGAGSLGAGAGWLGLPGSLAVQPPAGAWAWALPGLACLSLAGCACGVLYTAVCGRRRAHAKGSVQARQGSSRAPREQLPGLCPAARQPVPIGEEPWLQRRARCAPDGAGVAAPRDAAGASGGGSPRGEGALAPSADRAPLLWPPHRPGFETAAADAAADPPTLADSAGLAAGPRSLAPPSLAPPGPGFGPPAPSFGPPAGSPRAFARPALPAQGPPGQALGLPPPPALSPRLLQAPFQPLAHAGSVRPGAGPQHSFSRAPGPLLMYA